MKFAELSPGDRFTMPADEISRGRVFKKVPPRSQFPSLAKDEAGYEWVINPNTEVNLEARDARAKV